MLSPEEVIERTGGIPPTGPNMWCASLISGLFSMHIPGPGCTLTNISLTFHNRIHVGDRILVKVQVTAKDEETKVVSFDCEAHNGDGVSIFTGTAQAHCAGEEASLVYDACAEADSEQSVSALQRDDCASDGEAGGEDGNCVALRRSVPGGAIQAYKDKLIVPVLVGSEDKIREVAKTLGLDLKGVRIVDSSESRPLRSGRWNWRARAKCRC